MRIKAGGAAPRGSVGLENRNDSVLSAETAIKYRWRTLAAPGSTASALANYGEELAQYPIFAANAHDTTLPFPMRFAEVIDHTGTKDQLRQMVASDRLPHALILVGPEGCGSLPLALALAQYLLCTNRTATDSCGHCAGCKKAAKSVHPDLHFSFPTVGTNVRSDQYLTEWRKALADNPYLNVQQWLQLIGAENKQGNINKEECNAILKKISLKTFEGPYKVLVLWMAEYLGKEGNRLLKLIEEPPPDTVFIFVAEQPDQILNTILSRCQLVKLYALPDEVVSAALTAKGYAKGNRARTLAFLAGGSYNAALQLLEAAELNHSEAFVDWLRRIYKGHPVEVVGWVEAFAKAHGREAQKQFLQYGLIFLREMLVLSVRGPEAARLPEAELATAAKLNQLLDFEQLAQLSDWLSEAAYYIERNAHPRVLFLALSVRAHRLLRPVAA